MKILEELGFKEYGVNFWVKCLIVDNKKTQVLFVTIKKSGEAFLKNKSGQIIKGSSNEEELRSFIISELREFKLLNLL